GGRPAGAPGPRAAPPRRARHDRGRGRSRRVRGRHGRPASRRERRPPGRRGRLSCAGRSARRRAPALARLDAALSVARLVTRPLAACLAITSCIHILVYMLSATLPLHMVALGGSKTQVGLLFGVSAGFSMLLRPLVGGWVDRSGFRPVMLPGPAVLLAPLAALPLAQAPALLVALMAGIGFGNGLVSTSAGVLAAQASPAERRGEALSVYYVAASLAFTVGPQPGAA